MRNLKKVLALVLAMAMSLSLAVSAGAAFNDQDKIVNKEAVDMCVALNIINGRTDGSFDPAGNVTRAEMAKMICIVLNGGKEPTLSASATPSYTDIAGHWAAKYIEYCTSLGIVAGDGAGKFNPNGLLTGAQLAKMLLVALGYKGQFTVAAEGEGLKYQWYFKRPGVDAWGETSMEGANRPTVLIESNAARDGYQYKCRITDVTGNVVFTEPATMRVLSFTSNPKETFAATGSTVTFSVTASVDSGFTYQWQYSSRQTHSMFL